MRKFFISLFVIFFHSFLQVNAQKNEISILPSSDQNVYCYELTNDTLLYYCNTHQLVCYNLSEKKVLSSFSLETGSPVLAIEDEKECDLLFIGTKTGKLLAVSKVTGETVFEHNYNSKSITALAVAEDSKVLFVGLSDGMVYQHNIEKLEEVSEFYQHNGQVTSIITSTRNHLLGIASADGTVSLHNGTTLEYINRLKVSKKWIRDIAFNEELGHMVCVGDEGRLYEWNIKDHKKARIINVSKESGNWLLSVDNTTDGKAYCWGGVDHNLKVRHRFGNLHQKFKGPILQAQFIENRKSELVIAVCILGEGIRLVHTKDMKFKSLYN